MLLWALLACTRSPHADGLFAGCTDADCELSRAESAWEGDRDAVAAAIAAHPVPEARIALVSALIAAHPGETRDLCGVLPPGDAQDRCTDMNGRPHLWQETRTATPTGPRPGGGPASNEIAPIEAITSSLDGVPAAAHDCAAAPDHNGCITAAAQEAARQRRIQDAAGQCRNIETTRWQGECFFQAAEAATRARGAHGYADATELCAAAAPFTQNCHSHTLMLLAEQAPAADNSAPGAWQPLLTAAQAIRTAWSWRDPHMAEVAVDRLWSEATGRAYTGVFRVTGDPLAVLPEEAHRHVRAAAVRELMSREGAARYSLAGWVAQAERALQQRSPQNPRRPRKQKVFRSAPELWPTDLNVEEAALPATAYLGTARRTHAEEATIDLAICVLEAAGRTPPVHGPLMAEGAAHLDPRVQWTARRLLEMRIPPGG